jgi:hypothetical protein
MVEVDDVNDVVKGRIGPKNLSTRGSVRPDLGVLLISQTIGFLQDGSSRT